MKKNLSTRIKRSLSRIKALYFFITDVYLSLDSEFIVNYMESKSIVIMSDNRTIELHDNATYIENYGDGPKKKEEKAKAEEKFRPLPESLANPQGLMVLSSLAIHGFLDEHFQPKGLSVTKTAVLAFQISSKLGIQNVWVVFGTFWNIDKENLRSARDGPATDVWIYRRNCKIDKYLLASLLYNVNNVSQINSYLVRVPGTYQVGFSILLYLCPRNSEPIWSGFRGLLCIGTSTVVGAPNCFKKEFIR